jgi:hypothetical protein
MRYDPVMDDSTDILALAKEKLLPSHFTSQWEDKIGEIANASWHHQGSPVCM